MNSSTLRNSAHLGLWHECLLKRLPPNAQHRRSAHQFAAHCASGVCLDSLRGTGLAGIFAQYHLQVLRTPGDPWGGVGHGSCGPGVPFCHFLFDGSGLQPKHHFNGWTKICHHLPAILVFGYEGFFPWHPCRFNSRTSLGNSGVTWDRLGTVLGGCMTHDFQQPQILRRWISVLKSRSLGHARLLASKLSE